MAAMFFGSVAFGASGHTMQTSVMDNTGHVAMQQSGGAGHQLVAYVGNGAGRMAVDNGYYAFSLATDFSNEVQMAGVATTRDESGGMVAITNDGHRIAPRPAGQLNYFEGTMALMRGTWLMETNSGGFGHRLSQARQAQRGHQVMQAAMFKEHYSRRV